MSKGKIAGEEHLVVDFQCALQGALDKRQWRRRDLAAQLGVSEAKVSQMFADDANPTLKTVARAFRAAGYELVLKPKRVKQ